VIATLRILLVLDDSFAIVDGHYSSEYIHETLSFMTHCPS
jgi:hypothetical protein